jgi:glycosyltransferase involved in cell wall biosynthesis
MFPGVRQFVNACNLAGQVRLHGVASEEVKHRLLMECGVFVQHSVTDSDTGDEEGLPSSIQEAMGYGLAVVSTRHSGIPEAVEHATTGLLVEEGDVDAMADAMIAIGGSAYEMGREGHRRALTEHTWECEKSRLMHWIGMAA